MRKERANIPNRTATVEVTDLSSFLQQPPMPLLALQVVPYGLLYPLHHVALLNPRKLFAQHVLVKLYVAVRYLTLLLRG